MTIQFVIPVQLFVAAVVIQNHNAHSVPISCSNHEKLIYLSVQSCMNGRFVDFVELAKVLAQPKLNEAVDDVKLSGFVNYLQGLSSKELCGLTEVFAEPRTRNFKNIATVLGEGDNLIWFWKTFRFYWYGLDFIKQFPEMVTKYDSSLHVQAMLRNLPVCPCRLCIKDDDSTCIELSNERANNIIRNNTHLHVKK
ncbi:hypothetical protein DdX_01685 [Ditylenchus destructor]|uniref:Uncharacterized protein n=1 Tax=Ditylenchus destructor TaxID=166010 RepID=A0AAD4NNA1_9BILA|nr:hypothetical protein DdX_01685 [Ditylenchus destructor]